MTVYVDQPTTVWRFGKKWCHMIADTPQELREFAQRISMKLEWIQRQNTHKEHFDLMPSRRARAIRLGAVELSNKDLVRKLLERKSSYTKSV